MFCNNYKFYLMKVYGWIMLILSDTCDRQCVQFFRFCSKSIKIFYTKFYRWPKEVAKKHTFKTNLSFHIIKQKMASTGQLQNYMTIESSHVSAEEPLRYSKCPLHLSQN